MMMVFGLVVTLASFLLITSIGLVTCDETPELQPSSTTNQSCGSCRVPRPFNPSRHKEIYRIGVLNFNGPDSAYAQHNETFATYLTATAGQRFDPPLTFEMIPVDFQTMFDVAAEGSVDFLFVSPSPFACVEAEYGAQSLVSHIARRVVGDDVYELPNFAGVIFTRADNEEINKIKDLKGKVIGSAAISSFGGGQIQFRELQKAGLSYINDPKQLVFTGNQGAIVNGVLNGDFDAGFVRTDQIERTRDENGNLVDPTLFKVLESKDNFIDGEPFPFTASTPLYPEWNLASMDYVPTDVSEEVQAAMLSLLEFSKAGKALEECKILNANDTSVCKLTDVVPQARCDTTEYIANVAFNAMTNGNYAGFRTTQSYIDIRAMLQDTNFISKDEETNIWRCVRPDELYEAIVCPPGHFKKSQEEVESGCTKSGLECKEGYQCICNPCVKAFDVDVFPLDTHNDEQSSSALGSGFGCPKMSVCGAVQQTKELVFRAVDNKQREGATMSVRIHEGQIIEEVHVVQGKEPYTFEFSVSSDRIGLLVLEIKINDEQIPESPLRVEVVERDCNEEQYFDLHTADANGVCICSPGTITLSNSCIPYKVLLPSIFVPLVMLTVIAACMYVKRKTREADSVWYMKQSDLNFKSPPEVIGQGTFGLVLLAEYRGTKVAVKRALPPRSSTERSKMGSVYLPNDDVPMPKTKAEKVLSVAFDIPIEEELVHADIEERRTKLCKVVDNALDVVDGNSQNSTRSNTEKTNFEQDVELGKETPLRQEKHTSSIGTKGDMSKGGTRKTRLFSTGLRSTTTGTVTSASIRSRKHRFFSFSSGGSSKESKDDFIKEMRLLSKLRHPCITTVMGAVIEKGIEPLLVMEYMEHGSLYDIIHNESIFIDGEMMLHILRDISQGVRFLHGAEPPVIHGDLKSCNILVDSKFRAKVCDFGLSRTKNRGARGTPFWMAPELLRGDSDNTTATDMYSIGMILYELYSRKDPYEGEDVAQVIPLICDKHVNKRPAIPSSCPSKVAKLMKFLLLSEPKSRPTADVFDNRISDFETEDVEPTSDSNATHRRMKNVSREERSKDVLYQVFPRHIADVLQNGGKVEPESHESVTIFFSDIVGFTSIASEFEPLKVSNMLDRLYTSFDELTKKHDLFKIETIGDAYMCAGNLAKDQRNDHVKRVAEFAIEAVEVASKIPLDEDDPSLGYVQIRVGFHTGPVVSNIVGSLNPRYGVFGDTVNVSSRMESTSEPGRIHCSESSATLLMKQAPNISLVARGVTKIKGKGKMLTYWVERNTF